MRILTTIDADEGALKKILLHHPDGGGKRLEDRSRVPFLFHVDRVLDASGEPILDLPTGYWLAHLNVQELTVERLFDLTGNGIFLAVRFRGVFDETTRYRLEYFDRIFFLFRQDGGVIPGS